MGALSKLQLSLFCFVGSLCLQAVTLNLEEAFFVLHKSPHCNCPYLKINLKLKLQKDKKTLVSACELIRGVLVLQDAFYFSINMLWTLISSTNKGKGIIEIQKY